MRIIIIIVTIILYHCVVQSFAIVCQMHHLAVAIEVIYNKLQILLNDEYFNYSYTFLA